MEGFLGLLVLGAIIGGIVYYNNKKKQDEELAKEKERKEEELKEEERKKEEEILKQKWEEKKQEYAVNGLPILEGETIKLTKNEVCHFADVANFCKIKTHTTGYEGGSRGTSIRLMKGVSFRVGNYRGHYVKEEITEKTEGRIYLTSKKIVFTAPLNSCIIKYDAIINIGVTNGMVQFQTEDKTYLFQMENYLDFMIILESVAYKNEENE